MLQAQRGTIAAPAPVWDPHTSSRWVIPAGKRVGGAGRNVLPDFGVTPWNFHFSRSSRKGWSSSPPTPSSSSSSPKIFGFSSFPGGISLGFFFQHDSRDAAAHPLLPSGTVGCSWQGRSREGMWECRGGGSCARTSLLCPRCCSSRDNPRFRSFPITTESVKPEGRAAAWREREGFSFWDVFPSRRGKNPAEAEPCGILFAVIPSASRNFPVLRREHRVQALVCSSLSTQGTQFVPQTTRNSGHPTFPEVLSWF